MESRNQDLWPKGDFGELSRQITRVENGLEGYQSLLLDLPPSSKTVTLGITGPPGAGKSTLVDALLSEMLSSGLRIAVIAVDPSSPFSSGALLGDRIRMSGHFNHPDVYIRSFSSRGSFGGLNPRIIEITDLIRAWQFDYLLIETVGVGQSEVEIAGLADTTIVVIVPGTGDDIQMMKSGLLEVADIFALNKADRPHAEEMMEQLQETARQHSTLHWQIPVIKTVATENLGIRELLDRIKAHRLSIRENQDQRTTLMAKKAYELIRSTRMQDIQPAHLKSDIASLISAGSFNLYRFVAGFRQKE
ncbi:MAG TPA: methylmalonyl Co-A mutase-associated GTPase MeaB [Chitinophagaceae bacterium]|nr:methylmalonyl Co-A mutase-associated GTPase MeaB [Chitinophagaceae bacterium]